jgi:hypothetical protein
MPFFVPIGMDRTNKLIYGVGYLNEPIPKINFQNKIWNPYLSPSLPGPYQSLTLVGVGVAVATVEGVSEALPYTSFPSDANVSTNNRVFSLYTPMTCCTKPDLPPMRGR